jgi:hypothetical protein
MRTQEGPKLRTVGETVGLVFPAFRGALGPVLASVPGYLRPARCRTEALPPTFTDGGGHIADRAGGRNEISADRGERGSESPCNRWQRVAAGDVIPHPPLPLEALPVALLRAPGGRRPENDCSHLLEAARSQAEAVNEVRERKPKIDREGDLLGWRPARRPEGFRAAFTSQNPEVSPPLV